MPRLVGTGTLDDAMLGAAEGTGFAVEPLGSVLGIFTGTGTGSAAGRDAGKEACSSTGAAEGTIFSSVLELPNRITTKPTTTTIVAAAAPTATGIHRFPCCSKARFGGPFCGNFDDPETGCCTSGTVVVVALGSRTIPGSAACGTKATVPPWSSSSCTPSAIKGADCRCAASARCISSRHSGIGDAAGSEGDKTCVPAGSGDAPGWPSTGFSCLLGVGGGITASSVASGSIATGCGLAMGCASGNDGLEGLAMGARSVLHAAANPFSRRATSAASFIRLFRSRSRHPTTISSSSRGTFRTRLDAGCTGAVRICRMTSSIVP
jgi:hypothetical protein